MCDVCILDQNTTQRAALKDMLVEAKVIINLLRQISPKRITKDHLIDIYCGPEDQKIKEKGHDQLQGYGFGKGRSSNKSDMKRLLKQRVRERVVSSKVVTMENYPMLVIVRGRTANLVIEGSKKIMVKLDLNVSTITACVEEESTQINHSTLVI